MAASGLDFHVAGFINITGQSLSALAAAVAQLDLGGMGASPHNHRQMGMKNSLTLLVLLTLCSCSTMQRATHVPSGAPAALNQEFRRVDHEGFSSQERHIIAAARRSIRESGKLPKGASADAYYRVRHTADGYEVFVTYVTGYEGTQPLLTPCVHNAVLLREDGSVRNVLVGPECWPSP